MTMQARHFEFVAKTIRDSRTPSDTDDERRVIDQMAEIFADRFKDTNPRFKRDRFLKAAGVSE